MNIGAAICFFGVFALLLVSLRRQSDRVSPARTFLLVWLVCIGLTELKLSAFQSDWSGFAWMVLLLGIVSLLAGILASSVIHIGSPLLAVSEMRNHFSRNVVDGRRLSRIIFFLSLLYILAYSAEVLIEGQIPLFALRPDRARVEFGVFGLHLIVTAVPMILFLILEFFVFVREDLRRKLVLGALGLILLTSFVFLLQRFPLVIVLFMAIPLLYYTGRSLRIRNIVLFGGLSLTVFFYIQTFRFAQYVQNYLYVVSKMRFSVAFAPLTEPYMYIVMNLENFSRGVERLESFAGGFFSTDFILALTGLKHWLGDYFHLLEGQFLVSGYNTFPFLWPYYHDFGVLGVAFIPFVLGGIIGTVYYRLRSRPNVLRLVAYCIVYFGIGISFFTNPLTMLTTVFNFALVLLVHWYMIRSGIFLMRTEKSL